MTSQENVTAIVTVDDICNHHLYAAVKCLNLMIKNEVPADQADVAFIMQVMTKVSEQQRIKNGEVRDDVKFKLRLDEKSAVCLWHSVNIAMVNGMITQPEQQTFCSQLLSYLAIKLDQLITLMQSPDELEVNPVHQEDQLRLVEKD